ncbi:uncharacterized protein J3D65DRAFT_643217 [Phyllosticta citribraziliensis]|uniref:Uncharacterized protein n=1 Tax=Phyllosticta citribraziliensis TaxID=989973 RepID=A0ABR1L1P2_9PEZI
MLRATCGPLKRKVALLFLLTIIRPAISTPGAFDVDFTKNVAPAAKNSLDDKSRLPAQVCGIIGAYLAFVFLVGVSLLTFGRKMRRAVHERIDVVKANQSNGFELSPMSPGSATRSRWWAPQSPSRLKQAFKRNPGTTNPESVPTSPLSATESMASFDQHFLRNQQEQRQREMEKLYAAVMEHDEERRKQKIRESAEELADEDAIQKAAREAVQSPARLNTNSLYPPSPASPSPQSPVRAIHSSGGSRRQFSGPPPTLREGQGFGMQQEEPQSLSPRGFFSRARTPSYGSSESKPRRSIRNLRISSPIPRFSAAERDEEARTPLSPRHYTPGPPPEPPSATTVDTPTTAESLGPFRYDDLDRPPTYYRPDVPQQFASRRSASSPIKDPYRNSTNNNSPPPHFPLQTPTSPTAATVPVLLDRPQHHQPPPPALRLATATHSSQQGPPQHSAASSTSTLPFRALHPDTDAYSPVATKTTVLETRHRGGGGGGGGLLSPASRLRTPGTAGGGGVPMTPYSPYMPFTPITPVTPHLVTRKERKMREKEERRARGRAGVVDEEDEVGAVDWGDAY